MYLSYVHTIWLSKLAGHWFANLQFKFSKDLLFCQLTHLYILTDKTWTYPCYPRTSDCFSWDKAKKIGLMSDSLTTLLVESHWCPFDNFDPTNPRTNPAQFYEKILRIESFEKCSFFFLLNPMKSLQRFLGSKDGSKFWWLHWFPVH